MTTPPPRWSEDPDAPPTLRHAIQAGRDDLPDEAQLASLAARLGPLLGPGAGGGAGAGGAIKGTAGATAAKVIASVALSAAVLVGGVLIYSPEPADPESRASPAVEEPSPELPQEVEAEIIPDGIDVPLPAIDEQNTLRAGPRARRYENDPVAEAHLIGQSQVNLRTDPVRALALSEEHARRFGEGTLAQEREVVAIEALVRLGRRPEADARAAQFRARWPSSAHLRRLDVILAAP